MHLAAAYPAYRCSAAGRGSATRAAARESSRMLGRPKRSRPSKQINHDVKAVEYYVRRRVARRREEATLELVHFACTSEDINNLSHALMLASGAHEVLVENARDARQRAHGARPQIRGSADARAYPRSAGNSHDPRQGNGQRRCRLRRALQALEGVAILGKWNGAVGNFNAHVAAVPELDWPTSAAGS